jgi:prepilin-type N-terminal cleavage/methylation domain-containing protein
VRQAGFTLLELALVLAVLATLLGVTVLNLRGFGRSQALDETARRLETALRLARAEAANEGRCIRLEPDAETGGLRVLWEPEPLAAPGAYETYPCTWRDYLPGGSVRVVRCRLTGDSAYRTLWTDRLQEDGTDDELEPVTFYPDGTSDSAELELAGEERRAVVEIRGLTGTVSSRMLAADEWPETY